MRALVLLVLVGCGDNLDLGLFYDGDPDRFVLCSHRLDDYREEPDWERVGELMDIAAQERWVYLLHAHAPGETVSDAAIDRALTMAEQRQLPLLTLAELTRPQPGIALMFDDDHVDAWRALHQRFTFRATYFVTRFPTYSEAARNTLHELAARGNDIQAHSVDHVSAPEYVAEHGAQAWVDEQVVPSIEALRDAGFAADSFAYPFGARSDETDAAIQPHVRFVRSTAGTCPY